MSQFKIEWLDGKREPKCAPNPDYPAGIDVVVVPEAEKQCKVDLPYPAKRCGMYTVSCARCKEVAVVTTAGRADDPRSVTLPCKPVLQ